MGKIETDDQPTSNGRLSLILQKEILTFEEACIYLGRSKSFLYKLTSMRLIPHYVPNGKVIYFKRLELDEWILRNRRKTRNEINFDGDN